MDLTLSVNCVAVLIACWGVYWSRRAELRAASAESMTNLLMTKQLLTQDIHIKEGFKRRLKPLYGKGGIVDEAKNILNENGDLFAVVQAITEVARETDQDLNRATRRIIDWQAELIDYSNQLKSKK